MRLLTCEEICEFLSDSEKGIRYTMCCYSPKDQRCFGARGNFGVVRWYKGPKGRMGEHLGYFDDYLACRDFLISLLEARQA